MLRRRLLRPSHVFALRLRETREARLWSQARLEDEMTAAGRPIGRKGVTRLEAGERDVSLDEALAFAEVLHTVPAQLFIPPGRALIEVAAERAAFDGDAFRSWFRFGEAFEEVDHARSRADERAVVRAAQALMDAVRIDDEGARREALRAIAVAVSRLENADTS